VVEYGDDLSITEKDELLRYIYGGWIIDDPDEGKRVSSAAFRDHEDTPMSVFLRRELADVRSTDIYKNGHRWVVTLSAGRLKAELGQRICLDPDPNAPVGHRYVVGPKKSGTARAAFTATYRWVIAPASYNGSRGQPEMIDGDP